MKNPKPHTDRNHTPPRHPEQPNPSRAQNPRMDRDVQEHQRRNQGGRDQDRDGVVGSENDDTRHH